MKSFLLLLLSALFLLASCRKESEPLSECLQSRISQFADNSCEYDAEVKEYIFQGKPVFVFSMGFCGADLSAEVIDEDCNNLGNLGGFSGNTKINGEDFSDAKYVRTVWSR